MADDQQPSDDHITTLRRHMMDQLKALRAAPPGEALAEELKRAKGVSEVAQGLINAARVEVDYIKATNGNGESAFLQMRKQNQLPPWPFGTTQHRLEG